MDVIIKEVASKKDLKRFIQFGIDLYKGDPYHCPPLFLDELNTFNPQKNPAFEVCQVIQYIALDNNNKVVGRIVGIINRAGNEKWNVQKVRFGWFDFVDDLTVSSRLLQAVQDWGKNQGMTQLNGPVGFTDFDHQGLLIEGFEYLVPMASLYNYSYYQKHFEDFGLTKEADWIEYRVTTPKVVPERMERIAQLVFQRSGVRIVKYTSSLKLLRDYGKKFFDCIDKAYGNLYNYSPLTEKQKLYYAKMYLPLLRLEYVTLVVNQDEELVGVGVGMPNITKALQKTEGKLFPFGWIRILRALKARKIAAMDMLLIAVRPDYQNKGVNALFFYDMIPFLNQHEVVYSETTSILEDNAKNQANWGYFDTIQHKRRRAYVKNID